MISKINDNIYIGDQMDALNEELYKRYNFDEIINLNYGSRYEKEEMALAEKFKVAYVTFGYPQLFSGEVSGYIMGAVENNHKILVHCEAGIDRAPFAVAKYLSVKNKIGISKAYNVVKYFRPQTMEHYEWVK